jgi:hypothetical protein
VKKQSLKYEFIRLRAKGYTYNKICVRLNISKPTAIKWGRFFSEEIDQQQKYLISRIFSEKIAENEEGILTKLDQFRRMKKMKLNKRLSDKMDKKLLKMIEKIFIKRIQAIHLRMNENYITSAVFIFDKDLVAGSKE